MEAFAKWLGNELSQRDWGPADLARRIGSPVATVTRVLNGERNPGPNFCRTVARALRLPQYLVFYKAGLITSLPPELNRLPDEAKELIDLFLDLPPDEQEDFLEFLRRRAQRQKGGPNAATRKTRPAHT